MKKKLVMAAVALMLATLSVSANDAPKHYSDKSNGYSGISCAEYLGTVETYDLSYYDSGDFVYDVTEGGIKEDFDKQGFVITRPLAKLSKEEGFLIWSALGEYDVRDGEVYSVFVQCENSGECLTLEVEIYNNGRSFRDYGGLYFKEK